MPQRRVDRESLERADRESKLAIEAERRARDAKTMRRRKSASPSKQPSRTRPWLNVIEQLQEAGQESNRERLEPKRLAELAVRIRPGSPHFCVGRGQSAPSQICLEAV
jgi:hypothetical protein